MPAKTTLFVKVGDPFGLGTVTVPEIRRNGVRWVGLLCTCGTYYEARIANLAKPGHTMSCGCHRREVAQKIGKNGKLRETHGMSRHPLFNTWKRMVDRCTNPQHEAWHRYGGRGIRVCDRWLDVRAFIKDIERDLGPRPVGRTLDRWPDPDGNYEPGKVRWATAKEQRANHGAR